MRVGKEKNVKDCKGTTWCNILDFCFSIHVDWHSTACQKFAMVYGTEIFKNRQFFKIFASLQSGCVLLRLRRMQTTFSNFLYSVTILVLRSSSNVTEAHVWCSQAL